MNQEIVDQFKKLVKYVEAEQLAAIVDDDIKKVTETKFRLAAIKKSLKIINDLDFTLTSGKQIAHYEGIGKKTVDRIDIILAGGVLSELLETENKGSAIVKSILELSQIIGVGPAMAKKLVVTNKIMSIADLKAAIARGDVKPSAKVLLGLKYYDLVKDKIPREEITETKELLEDVLHTVDPELKLLICGSYRRGRATSGDIDVLIYHPNEDPRRQYLQEYVQALEKSGLILDSITDKNFAQGYMGFSRLDDTKPVRRIDIKYIPYESMGAAALYFTGPVELNVEMRKKAKSMGMILNQYGLFRIGDDTPLELDSEREIFDALGYEYMTPKQRELAYAS